MYNKNKVPKTNISRNTSYVGESIEKKMARILSNKEPIKDGAPIIYTDRKDGVRPEFDIRTDRWEKAVEGMEQVQQAKYNEREQRIGERTYDTMNEEQKANFHKKFPENKFKADQKPTPGEGKIGGAEPIPTT